MPTPLYINNQFKYLQWGTGKCRRNFYLGGVLDQWYDFPTEDFTEGNENYNALLGIGKPYAINEDNISPNGGTGIFYVCANGGLALRNPTSNMMYQARIQLDEDAGGTYTYGGEVTQTIMQHDNNSGIYPLTMSAVFRITDSFGTGGNPPRWNMQWRNISTTDEVTVNNVSLTVIRLS